MSKLGRYAAQRRKVTAITTTKTVTVAECGTMFTIDADDSAYDITLPKIADCGKGWWCQFTMIDINGSNDIDIVAHSDDADQIYGPILGVSGSSAQTHQPANADGSTIAHGLVANAADKIIFDASDTQTIGDMVEIWTDGNNWYCFGIAGAKVSALDPSG